MDDLGINKYLETTYGKTVEGLPLFRLVWSTGLTEHRFSEFHDYYGDILLRVVRETREVLKYPYSQNRWVLERVRLTEEKEKELGLQTDKKYHYEEIYIFQDKQGNFLPLSQEKIEEAMFLYFKFYVMMTPVERRDFKMTLLAQREMEKKKKTKEIVGRIIDPAPHSIVFEPFKMRRS